MPAASPSTSKTDVRAVLARLLLTREVGQRIPTVQELQHASHAGAGTVVKVLRSLQDNGAVTLSSHGHQGTLVVARDVGRLWREAQLGNFSLIMPPPGPVEQHGILDAVQESLARQGVPVVVSALAGARRRLEELHHERVDAVVASAGAFERHRDDFPGLRSLDLGDSTFYSAGSLVVVERPDPVVGRRLRVGIDRASHDHQLLTEAEFAGQEVEYVDWRFVSAPAAVLRGRVDAAVWHSMPTVISPELAGLTVRPLRDGAVESIRDVSRAVLVTRELDAGVNALLRAVSPAEVAKVQARLLRRAAESESETEFWPR